MSQIRSICVYCGSQPGTNSRFIEAARTLGESMANNGIRLIYGGGTRGIMGAVADSVLRHGGAVTGIIPDFLVDKESSQSDLEKLSETIITQDMHTRKHTMFERADAFVTLPGGIGTLEELIEMMTWAQLGRHDKPIVLANVDGFWNPLLELINHMDDSGFIHTKSKVAPIVVDDPAEIVPLLLG